MRIAFVSLMGGQPWGGSEVLWHKMALRALTQGHEVLVSIYDWGKNNAHQITELKEKGAKIHLRKKWAADESILKKIKRRLAKKRSHFTEEWKELLKFKPDSVFISQGDNFDLVIHHAELYYLLKNNNISYSFVCHNHSQYSHFLEYNQYNFAREVFENAKKVWFVSHRQLQLTERKLCMKLTNAEFTWNPLNLKSFEYIDWPSIEPVQMAIVGNLISGKGHDTIFEVLSSEKWKQRNNWQLNIYGKGNGESYLKELAKFLNIEERIIFHGHVDSATQIWEKNHILLIPSSGEGLPISLVEAAICGRPAVVTDVGGNSEIIKDSENGFIAEAPSVKSFEKTMERAWQKIEDWKKMGIVANELIVNKFDYNPEITLLKRLLKQND